MKGIGFSQPTFYNATHIRVVVPNPNAESSGVWVWITGADGELYHLHVMAHCDKPIEVEVRKE